MTLLRNSSWLSGRVLDLLCVACFPQLAGILLLGLEMVYPLLHTDKKGNDAGMLQSMFRFRAYFTDLTLMGVSPYARHSHAALLLAYKAVLYAILLGGAVLASQGLKGRWATKRINRADTLFLAAVAVYVLMPLTPDIINGAWLGGRLLIFAWLFMLMGASHSTLTAGGRRLATVSAIVAFLLTMLPAHFYIRPAAKRIAAIEATPLPSHQYGLILVGPALEQTHSMLEFSPVWAPMLAMMQASDIPVNSPWLEQIYYIVKPTSDQRLMINAMSTREAKHAMDVNHGSIAFLPVAEQDTILSDADFLLTEGFEDNGSGRIGLLSASQSAHFVCRPRVDGIQVCPRSTPSH